jgi:hypothetical protein
MRFFFVEIGTDGDHVRFLVQSVPWKRLIFWKIYLTNTVINEGEVECNILIKHTTGVKMIL